MKKLMTIVAAVATLINSTALKAEAIKWSEIGEYSDDREIKRVWIYRADYRDSMSDIIKLAKNAVNATEDMTIVQYFCGDMDAWGARYDSRIEVYPGGITQVYVNNYKRTVDGRLPE